jgi:Na+/melibiose symporter-like transporter
MKPKNSRQNTYTKKMLNRIITVALLDMQFPFLLALLGKQDIAETMGGLIVTEIIGVFLVYCAKSFFETKESEKTRLLETQNETEDETYE